MAITWLYGIFQNCIKFTSSDDVVLKLIEEKLGVSLREKKRDFIVP